RGPATGSRMPRPRSSAPAASPRSTRTPSTSVSTLSLHDALPIYRGFDPGVDVVLLTAIIAHPAHPGFRQAVQQEPCRMLRLNSLDRKSTRLNSSHVKLRYAVFCLKKKTRHGPAGLQAAAGDRPRA